MSQVLQCTQFCALICRRWASPPLVVSGDYDYLLRIVVKDTRDYERLLREKLYKIKGIRHSRSSFVLRTLKKADLPLFAT